MIRLLAIDLDGTLLNSFHEISEENKTAIRKAQEHGVKVIIATGRPEQLCKSIVKELSLKDDIIMSNGGVIGHPFKRDKVLSKTLNMKIVKTVVDYCETNDIIYLLYTAEAIISKPNFRVGFFENKNKNLPTDEHVIFKGIENLEDVYRTEPNKILVVEENSTKLSQAKEYFSTIDQISIVQSQTTFIDVSPRDVSKGFALKAYAEYLNLDPSEVAAMGDQDNDISMLKYAGTAIAMENASKGCMEVSNHVTLSNNAHGVAYAINEFVLKGQN